MKTLINKENPAIRITAPDEMVKNRTNCWAIWSEGTRLMLLDKDHWTLVEEEETTKIADSILPNCTANAKSQNRWHKVSDSLPDTPREVLCKDAIGNYFIGRYYGKEPWEVSVYDDTDKTNEYNPPVVEWADILVEEEPTEDWREKRKEECPFRKADGCERYAGLVSECNGICSWVVDYPKLKEIQDKKEQEQPSSNLDEAAEDFVWEVMENDENGISELSRKLRPSSKINDFYDALEEFFKAGAEWQKKQDELTWEDLQKLDIIANELWQDGKYDKNDAQEFYTEVLKRFKEYKEQKNK